MSTLAAPTAAAATNTPDPGDLVPSARDIERVYDAYCGLMLQVEETTNPLVRGALMAAAQTLNAQLTILNTYAKHAATN